MVTPRARHAKNMTLRISIAHHRYTFLGFVGKGRAKDIDQGCDAEPSHEYVKDPHQEFIRV